MNIIRNKIQTFENDKKEYNRQNGKELKNIKNNFNVFKYLYPNIAHIIESNFPKEISFSETIDFHKCELDRVLI